MTHLSRSALLNVEVSLALTPLDKKFARLRRAKKAVSKASEQTGGGPAESPKSIKHETIVGGKDETNVGGKDQGSSKQSKNLQSILKKEAIFKSTPRPLVQQETPKQPGHTKTQSVGK